MSAGRWMLVAACAVFLAWMAWTGLMLPTVYRSQSTGTCVSVEPAEAGTCAELPGRYHHVWTE